MKFKNLSPVSVVLVTVICVAIIIALALGLTVAGCASGKTESAVSQQELAPVAQLAPVTTSPAPLDMAKAEAEVAAHYRATHPEIREYVLWTARSFGPSGMWLNEDAFAALPADAREEKIQYLATLLKDGEYGRHLCAGLAEAGALKDTRLVSGLMKVAGYHVEGSDYDCRPKWMAVAALARQDSEDPVPLFVSLVDHGNQNTRNWARAALARKTGQDFAQDKQAWAKWWQTQGHEPIADEFLKPWSPPPRNTN